MTFSNKRNSETRSQSEPRRKVIGKTEARQRFLPLVDELKHNAAAIEITDHDEPVAVLLGYHYWNSLLSKLARLEKDQTPRPRSLIGSVQILSDLDAASKEIAKEFETAIKKSAKNL